MYLFDSSMRKSACIEQKDSLVSTHTRTTGLCAMWIENIIFINKLIRIAGASYDDCTETFRNSTIGFI
jgi:hypothetical protein